MGKRLTKFDYAWHHFWTVATLGALGLSPFIMWYGYAHWVSFSVSFASCFTLIMVPFLILIDSEVSWSRRMERARKLLKK